MTAPAIDLPREIVNIEMARRYIAEKFEVPVENVARMGESFFCHNGVTPQRIFPFAMTGVARGVTKPLYGTTEYAPLSKLCDLIWYDCDLPFMVMVARTFARFGANSEHSVKRDFSMKMGADISKPVAREDVRGVNSTPKADDGKPADPENKKRLDPK